MTDCPRLTERDPPCQFEARYDEGPSRLPGSHRMENVTPEMLDRFRCKIYVKDVCIRCGKTIKREN